MELVERLYHRLVQAASEWPPEDAAALTIADLYQHLIPYRGVRGDLGVLELAQYEHALLRLLAGEGGFLRVRDEEVRRELSSELDAPNPILGIYRDYAGVEVELRDGPWGNGPAGPSSVDAAAPGDASSADRLAQAPPAVEPLPPPLMQADAVRVAPPREPRPDRPPTDLETAQEGSELPTFAKPAAPPPRPAVPAATPPPSAPATHQATCIACGEPLPDVEGLRFCPSCGVDQSQIPCEQCGTPLRRSWNFCIRCGAARSGSPAVS